MPLLLLAVLAASLVSLLFAADCLVAGRVRAAGRILLRWGVGAVGYLTLVVAVAFLLPQKVLKPGNSFCDDDWCMSIESVNKKPAPDGIAYKLGIRIFSHALRTPQSAARASVYLVDQSGRRFLPVNDYSAAPFDVTVQPGESVNTSLTFEVPEDARDLFFTGDVGIVYASFIVGNGDLIHKPRVKYRVQ